MPVVVVDLRDAPSVPVVGQGHLAYCHLDRLVEAMIHGEDGGRNVVHGPDHARGCGGGLVAQRVAHMGQFPHR